MRGRRLLSLCLVALGAMVFCVQGGLSAESQFDFVSFIKSAYDAYNKVKALLEPPPDLADLIEQAKNEIIHEINAVRVEEQIGDVNALLDEYTLYLRYPPTQQTIEAWIRDAINVANQFELIIHNKSPRIAYLSARSYNTLIPLMALMMQRYGIQTSDITPFFRRAIDTNTILLGRFVWADLSNVPLYWNSVYGDGSYVGKLLKCYSDGVIDWAEYERVYKIVWTASEEMRNQTIEGYREAWFYISNERDFAVSPNNNLYLCARSRPRRAEAKVRLLPLSSGDTEFLWRLEFLSPSQVKIVHWSGKYLAMKEDKRRIVITPRPEWQNEYWDLNPNYFFYRDRVTVTAAVENGYWLTADGDSVRAFEASYAPSALGYQSWIVHHALTGAPPVGSVAFPCPADYDGDGKADLGMKLDDGRWLIDFAGNGFGGWDRQVSSLSLPAVDKYSHPAPADYDGDGKADIAVKDDFTGQWCIDYAANGLGSWDLKLPYGGSTWFYHSQAVPADYDGDNKADVALVRYYGGWSVDYSSDGFGGWNAHAHGFQNYYPEGNIYPAPADYDGDGKTDVAIKVDDGRWLIDWARDGFQSTDVWDWVSTSNLNYGDISALPVPGRYGSDRAAAIGVRTEEGRWMTDAVTGWGFVGIDWVSAPIYGSSHALAVPMDYDGDGRLDLSVVEEEGTWLIDYSANGYSGWDWSARLSIRTGISEERAVASSGPATDFYLAGFPNPSRGPVAIEFSLREPQLVQLKIYNVLGQEVAELAAEARSAGRHRIVWQPEAMPNGTYVCRLVTGEGAHTVKLLLLQ